MPPLVSHPPGQNATRPYRRAPLTTGRRATVSFMLLSEASDPMTCATCRCSLADRAHTTWAPKSFAGFCTGAATAARPCAPLSVGRTASNTRLQGRTAAGERTTGRESGVAATLRQDVCDRRGPHTRTGSREAAQSRSSSTMRAFSGPYLLRASRVCF